MFKSLLLLFLSVPVFSQIRSQQVVGTFSGLDDTNAPNTIDPSRSQAMLNVEANVIGTAVRKRDGYSQQFAMALTTAPIAGSFSYTDINGNRQDIICYDRYCAKSTNLATPTVFISSGGRSGSGAIPTRWSFTQSQGTAYMANDARDQIAIYDGSTLHYSTSMPQGAVVEMTKDRLAVADVTASPNSVYYSQSGSYTNFTVGINSYDAYVDNIGAPGDRTSALKFDGGKLAVFKTNSVTLCILGDQYTSQCGILSNNIGTLEPLTVTSTPDGIYFRGQDRNYWRLTEDGLTLISRNISNLVASQTAGFVQSNTQTTKADWDAGTQRPVSSWNTSTVLGSVFPSSNTFVDAATNAFSSGTYFNRISTTDVAGISLTSTTFKADFETGLLTPQWTVSLGNWAIEAGAPFTSAYHARTASAGNHTMYAPSTISTGAWMFAGQEETASSNLYFHFITNGTDPNASQGYSLDLSQAGGPESVALTKYPGATIICSFTQAGAILRYWKVTRTAAGAFDVLMSTAGVVYASQCTGTDTTYNTSTNFVLYSQAANTAVDDFYAFSYSTTGVFMSRIFDTSFSSPTWGTFNSTFSYITNNVEGQVDFYTRTSTSPNNDMWITRVASSDTLRPGLSGKRYVQYEADLFTFTSTKTPTVTGVSLISATTGLYQTQCITPGSQITGYGLLSCAETKAGNGSLVYYATSAYSCAALPATPPTAWSSVTNGTTLSIGVSSSVYIGFASLLGSATDQAQVDACTLYWNNGTASPPAWGVYDSNKNSIYWTSSINNSSTNNRFLKYDLNRQEWFPFDLAVSAPRFINNYLYFGSSTGGYWNLYGNGATSDNGSAINSYFKTKDFGGDSAFSEKDWADVSIVARNAQTGSLNVTWTNNRYSTGTYIISLSTSGSVPYIRSNYYLPKTSPATFFNLQFGNNAANQPWEVDGYGLDYSILPWRVITQ